LVLERLIKIMGFYKAMTLQDERTR
jgi:hypothetical protein